MKNYTIQEMRKEKEVITPIYDLFVDEIDERLKVTSAVTMPQINYCIDKAMSSIRLTKEQKKVVNAFFDTYVGAWLTVDRDVAEEIVFAVTTDLADQNTKFLFI